MMDNEIIKALENVSEWFTKHGGNTNTAVIGICKEASDLIKRQQAEIERYKGVIKLLEKDVSTAKTDGIKQFSEKLKDYAWYYDVDMHALDRLEKEMLEAINGA